MSFEKVRVPSVRDAFVNALEQKILSGELQPGDKLPPAKELCALMGVSMTTVNAGIRELVSRGFLIVRPRHGTYVADYRDTGNLQTFFSMLRLNGEVFPSHEVRSFCEGRIAIDPYVAELVIRRASDEEIRSLEPIVEQIEREEDPERLSVLMTSFYSRFYRMSDNTFFALVYNASIEPQRGIYCMYFRKNGTEHTKRCARRVYELVRARDIPGARELLIKMMTTTVEGDTALI